MLEESQLFVSLQGYVQGFDNRNILNASVIKSAISALV